MCIMHMMPGPSSDGEFIHSFTLHYLVWQPRMFLQVNKPPLSMEGMLQKLLET
jgi:hypothetical protein